MKKPIRVLQIVSGDFGKGGEESFLINIYKNIDRENVQFDFWVPGTFKNCIYKKQVLQLGSNIFEFNLNGNIIYKKLLFTIKLYLFLKKENYKIIHIHSGSFFVMLLASLCARLNNVPTRIVHCHSSNTNSKNRYIKSFLHFLLKPILNYTANNFFACSYKAAKWMYIQNILNDNKVHIIKNGIDINVFKYNQDLRNNYRKILNLENKFVIGHIGRFVEVKNHTFILDIFKDIHEQNKDSILIFVGNGILEKQIKIKAEMLNIKDSVVFLGFKNNIVPYLQTMDIFLLPSYFEGLPIVSIEAQATGLKCFLSDTITEECNITGLVEFISLNKSSKYWANEILKYNCNYERKSYSNTIAKSGYSINAVTKKLENFYLNN